MSALMKLARKLLFTNKPTRQKVRDKTNQLRREMNAQEIDWDNLGKGKYK